MASQEKPPFIHVGYGQHQSIMPSAAFPAISKWPSSWTPRRLPFPPSLAEGLSLSWPYHWVISPSPAKLQIPSIAPVMRLLHPVPYTLKSYCVLPFPAYILGLISTFLISLFCFFFNFDESYNFCNHNSIKFFQKKLSLNVGCKVDCYKMLNQRMKERERIWLYIYTCRGHILQ